MRRLIISRPVRLALAVALAAGVAAGLVIAVRRRRVAVPVPSAPRADRRRETVPEPAGRGPEPVLGWPTAEDLERYDRPEGGAPIARLLAGLPRGERPRGIVPRRWVVAAAALGLLAIGAQILDDSVFGPAPEASFGWTVYVGDSAGPCLAAGCPVAPDSAPSADPAGADSGGAGAAPPEPAPSSAPACEVRKASTTPVVRPISRRVTTAVNRQWRRIERWLKTHAPRTYASLNGPASPRLVAKAEARLGTPIPDSLRASLLRHNGARGSAAFQLPPYHAIMGARGIVSSWPEACEMGGGIPFAYSSDFGDYLVTNSATGGVGSADWETPYFEDEWSSYHALLKATADALAEGGPVGGSVPVVREGVLEWE
ncbi:SMI1/KNR4 family protein [Microbispora sp. NPDC088329]|uniref:SMI1/KNR4 family protein n=1 Tax=Microbispora sp. NPDC088329 TaxID=3154869 RepID=UPI003422B78B